MQNHEPFRRKGNGMEQNCSSGRTECGNEILEKEVNSGHLADYPDVMNVKQVMQILGICRPSVNALIDRGELGAHRIGRRIIIPKVCVQDFLNSARVGQSATADACQGGTDDR